VPISADYQKIQQRPNLPPQNGTQEDRAMDGSPFHADEIAVQTRLGAHPYAAGIRPFMPDQHRQFFAMLPYVFVSVPDTAGWPVATILAGPTGFVDAPSPVTLRVDAMPLASDPAKSGFVAGNDIGILGLDLSTRRRNRANGRISSVDGDGFTVDVRQSFGNCAQYIQTRTAEPRAGDAAGDGVAAVDGIDDDARALIAASDTFFVASRSRDDVAPGGGPGGGPESGLDMSHRGGRPGFVRVDGGTLVIPDFKGNRFFNTLGNFVGDDRAGLLFIDFEAGDVLQVAGRVTIDWEPPAEQLPRGAQRLWRVEIARSWWRRGALPYRWGFAGYAPTTLATGTLGHGLDVAMS
jgi:predicted pyridoxine 5'-phosphate oxidase superfamily flavin-nucleotide-binding protein